MKITCFNVKKKRSLKNLIVNCVIVLTLFTVFGFTFAGGTMQVFSNIDSIEAIYNGNKNSNKITLMINVYWGDEYLQPMLDVMEEFDVKTTFFVGGVWASKNQEMLQKFLENGHEIGNHGYQHKDQDKIDATANYYEISQTHQIVKNLAGVEMNLFAPPSGAYNNTTLATAEDLGYKTIMWTRDTIDWRDKDAELIYNRAIKNAKGGDLILMHPTQETLNALPKIIKTLQEKGFYLTTVSENLV